MITTSNTVQLFRGDVFHHDPSHEGTNGVILAHLCNDSNGFGSGVAYAISKKFPVVKSRFHELFEEEMGQTLGCTQLVRISPTYYVANMVAQRGYGLDQKGRWKDRVDYDWLDFCLRQLNATAIIKDMNVIMPKIGSGLAGGDWGRILGLIENIMTVPTFIYHLDENQMSR